LRISECLNLKIKDIDSNRMQIRVEQSKGKKDRYTLLNKKTLTVLREYLLLHKPKLYSFEAQFGDKYTTRSIQNVCQAVVKKVKSLKKFVYMRYTIVLQHTY
jgi:integrase/recombinase XerD